MIRMHQWGFRQPLHGTAFNRGHPLARGLVGLFMPHTIIGSNMAGATSKWWNLAKPMPSATYVDTDMERFNKFGNVVYLKKSSNLSRVDWGNDSIFDFASGKDFTLSMWICPIGGDSFYGLIARCSSTGNGWSIYRDDNSGADQYKLAFIGWNGGSGTLGSHVNNTLTSYTWYHMVCRIKDGYARFWMDGVQQTQNLATGTIGTSTDSLYFGKHYNDLTGYCWQGFLGPCKIWKRAIHENEIRLDFESPLELFNYPGTQQEYPQVSGKWPRGRVQGDFIDHRQNRRMVA